MENSSAQRLRKLRSIMMPGATAAAAAKRLGLKEVTYRAAETRGVSKGVALRIAQKWGVSVEWLLTGRGDGPVKDASLLVETVDIPLLSWEHVPQFRSLLKSGSLKMQRIPADLGLGDNVFMLILEDDSMVDARGCFGKSFPAGNRCIFDPDKAVRPGDLVIAVVPGLERAVFRRYAVESVLPDGTQVVALTPLNPDHPTFRITPPKQGHVIARLVARLDIH